MRTQWQSVTYQLQLGRAVALMTVALPNGANKHIAVAVGTGTVTQPGRSTCSRHAAAGDCGSDEAVTPSTPYTPQVIAKSASYDMQIGYLLYYPEGNRTC